MTSKVSKEKIGYKNVRMKNEKYYSITVETNELACVEYAIGKTSKPKPGCGPLCVFRSLRDAKWHCFEGNVIMKVRYIPSEQQSVWTSDYSRCLLGYLFDGTILADSVTPIKVIK